MAATDLNTVRSTIDARLATELASSPAIPVVFNNTRPSIWLLESLAPP